MAAVDEVDILESWEEMDDLGLDRKFSNLLAANPEPCSKNTQRISNGGSVKVMFDINDSMGAQLMTQTPSVTILRRPSAGVNGSNANGECKARPVKTLQQRQQEYEEARLRILGEARCPEDFDENITNLQKKIDAIVPQAINRIKEKPTPEQQPLTKVLINNMAPVTQPRILTQPLNLVNLLRNPRGPDGSKGFQLKR